jgi:hypothetical protein
LADKAGDDVAATEPLTELPDFEPIDEKKAPSKGRASEAPAKESPDFEAIDEKPAKKAPSKEKAREAPAKARATTEKEAPAKEEVHESAGDPFEDLLNELQ